MSSNPPAVAFLGLGLMGSPMAKRLAEAGLLNAVWNRSSDKAANLGVAIASNPAAAVAGAEIVCLCLTDSHAIEAVLFGTDGAAGGLGAGTIVVDFSTQGVETTRDFAQRLAKQGVAWLDAPVSGGVAGAVAGSLVVFAGGDAAVLARAQPVLRQVSQRVSHLGPIGAGQAAKLCNQLIVSANLLAIAEAMTLGRSLGVDVAALPGALKGGFADSTPLQVFGPRMASGAAEPKLGSIGVMLKDVEAICAASPGLSLGLIEKVRDQYRAAGRQGWSDSDLSLLTHLYAQEQP